MFYFLARGNQVLSVLDGLFNHIFKGWGLCAEKLGDWMSPECLIDLETLPELHDIVLLFEFPYERYRGWWPDVHLDMFRTGLTTWFETNFDETHVDWVEAVLSSVACMVVAELFWPECFR